MTILTMVIHRKNHVSIIMIRAMSKTLLIIHKVLYNLSTRRLLHAKSEDTHELLRKHLEYLQIINEELAEYINSSSWNRPAFYDDDDDDEYSIQVSKKSPIAIAPVLPTEEPKNSLSMGDEHLITILEMESDEVIKSSVEDLVPIPSESEGILDNIYFDFYPPKIDYLLKEFAGELAYIDPIPPGIVETDSDPKDGIRFIEQIIYDDTLSEDDSFEDIDYVEASPLDSKLVSIEEVQNDILHEKLLNIHLLIDMIESLNKNRTPDYVLKSHSSSFLSYLDNSLPEFETFSDHTKETVVAVPLLMMLTLFPSMIRFSLRLSPIKDSNFSSSDDSIGSGFEVSIKM
nr:hypothetical protein [Tanacetum cinerariifolium]